MHLYLDNVLPQSHQFTDTASVPFT